MLIYSTQFVLWKKKKCLFSFHCKRERRNLFPLLFSFSPSWKNVMEKTDGKSAGPLILYSWALNSLHPSKSGIYQKFSGIGSWHSPAQTHTHKNLFIEQNGGGRKWSTTSAFYMPWKPLAGFGISQLQLIGILHTCTHEAKFCNRSSEAS